MAEAGVQVVGLGASTPVGRTVWASVAAARAGLSGFSEHPFMRDTVGEPMCVARVPWLDIAVDGWERYWALLLPAITEALATVSDRRMLRAAGLCLSVALPPKRPGSPPDLAPKLYAAVEEHLSDIIDIDRTAMFEFGHAAAYSALDSAMRELGSSNARAWIVAGVDSYLAPETLEWIEACDQLHGAGPMNNAWGFIPGEAAGAVVVTSRAVVERLGLRPLGEIVAVGLGREEKLIKTDGVCIGEGLTAAFRTALDGLGPGEQIHNVFCDLNGETYRADEYGFTALRTKDRFLAATDFVAPADVWGDVGAASGPLHLAQALVCHYKRYGKGPTSMTWASSESGERGAAVVRAAEPRDV